MAKPIRIFPTSLLLQSTGLKGAKREMQSEPRRYSLIRVIFNDPASLNSMIGAVAFFVTVAVILLNPKPLANPTLVQQSVVPVAFLIAFLFAIRWAYVVYDNLTLLRDGTEESATLVNYQYNAGGSKLNRFGEAYWIVEFADGLQLMTQTIDPGKDVRSGDKVAVILSASRHRCLIKQAFCPTPPEPEPNCE